MTTGLQENRTAGGYQREYSAGGARLATRVTGTLIRTLRLEHEWFVDLVDPEVVIEGVRAGQYGRADLFTFWQRLPARTPAFNYYWEPDFVAALPVSTYEAWWKKQIDGKTRNLVRKGEKKGLEVHVAAFDDALVNGITKIFNETPVRQARRFWHYGKTCEQVRTDIGDSQEISLFIGAYIGGELIGFVKLLLLREYAMMVEIISEIKHRDKAPNNALVAAAVRECADRCIPFLTYSTWGAATLATFKQNNGFERMGLPRYYVPLTRRGQLALRLNLHQGIWARLPEDVRERLRAVRGHLYRSGGR